MLSYSKYIIPLNYLEEKERFFTKKKYNPTFKYKYQSVNFDLSKSHSSKKKLFENLISGNLKQWEIEGQKRFNCYFEIKLLEKGIREISQINSNIREKSNDLSEIIKYSKEIFKILGIDFHLVFTNRSGFNARPLYPHKKLQISNFAILEYLNPKGLVTHELVHILRYLNTLDNGIKSKNYLPTDEGLACYIEDFFTPDFLGKKSYIQHLADYIGCFIASKSSFLDVYEFYRSIDFSPELSYQRASRCKFGVIDTSLPGANMKIGMYYYNEMLVKQFLKEYPDKLEILFLGRINLKRANKMDYQSSKYSSKLDNIKIFLDWVKK